MKLGIQINRFDFPGGHEQMGEKVAAVAKAAEENGFDSIWVMDHFFQIGHLGEYTEPMMEAYTTLGYIAGVTNKVKLGTMVTGVIYREPALLIKAVTSLDVLSGGRAYLGIGAGWNDQEANALGFLDPLHSKRFARLEDTLKLAKQMWAGDFSEFKGEVYTLPEPYLSPMPVSRPHPPILIGGGGEEKTLLFVAKYADACNLFARDIEQLTHKLEVLKQHCESVGRDYNEIEKTALAGMNVSEAAQNINKSVEAAQKLKELGIDHLIYANSRDADTNVFSELKPATDQIRQL